MQLIGPCFAASQNIIVQLYTYNHIHIHQNHVNCKGWNLTRILWFFPKKTWPNHQQPTKLKRTIQKPPGDLRGCGWASSHRDLELPMIRAYLPCGQDFTDMIWIRRYKISMREIRQNTWCRFWCQNMFVEWWWQLLCRYLLSSWVVWTLSNLCIWCWVYTVGTRSVLHIRISIGMWTHRARFY